MKDGVVGDGGRRYRLDCTSALFSILAAKQMLFWTNSSASSDPTCLTHLGMADLRRGAI